MDEQERKRERGRKRRHLKHYTLYKQHVKHDSGRWQMNGTVKGFSCAARCLWGEWKITHTPHVALDASSFKCSLSQKWQSFVTHAWQIIRERQRERERDKESAQKREIQSQKRVLQRKGETNGCLTWRYAVLKLKSLFELKLSLNLH